MSLAKNMRIKCASLPKTDRVYASWPLTDNLCFRASNDLMAIVEQTVYSSQSDEDKYAAILEARRQLVWLAGLNLRAAKNMRNGYAFRMHSRKREYYKAMTTAKFIRSNIEHCNEYAELYAPLDSDA